MRRSKPRIDTNEHEWLAHLISLYRFLGFHRLAYALLLLPLGRSGGATDALLLLPYWGGWEGLLLRCFSSPIGEAGRGYYRVASPPLLGRLEGATYALLLLPYWGGWVGLLTHCFSSPIGEAGRGSYCVASPPLLGRLGGATDALLLLPLGRSGGAADALLLLPFRGGREGLLTRCFSSPFGEAGRGCRFAKKRAAA